MLVVPAIANANPPVTVDAPDQDPLIANGEPVAQCAWPTSTVSGACGGNGTHSLLEGAIPWLEAESGLDITPCTDASGNWAPGPNCGGYNALSANQGTGTWDNWCSGIPVSSNNDVCGPAWDAFDDSNGGVVTTDAAVPYLFKNATFDQEGLFTMVAIAEDWAGNVAGLEQPPLTMLRTHEISADAQVRVDQLGCVEAGLPGSLHADEQRDLHTPRHCFQADSISQPQLVARWWCLHHLGDR